MKSFLQNILYRIVKPVSKFIAKLEFPCFLPKLSDSHYNMVEASLIKGDVILTHKCGQVSNWFIPGEYDHIAWYLGEGLILEATTKGVVETKLKEMVLSKNKIACFRSIFATAAEMSEACEKGKALLGKEYDFAMNIDNDKWYCSELIYMKTKEVMESHGKEMPFELRERLGVKTIAPDDFKNAVEKWNCTVKVP